MSLRHAAALGAATLVLGAGQAAAADLNWTFDVLLDNKEIGYHEFRVSEKDGRQILQTEAEFDVKFLFITAFRYRHENTEAWQGKCLQTIDARTDSNGRELTVRGERDDDAFRLQVAEGSAALPACVQTFAYWKPEILNADQLLNSQTGELEDVTVTPVGQDIVRVGGKEIAASRYRLSAKAGDITLWYAANDGRWLALEAPAKGGRTLRYQPVAIPDADETRDLMANGG